MKLGLLEVIGRCLKDALDCYTVQNCVYCVGRGFASVSLQPGRGWGLGKGGGLCGPHSPAFSGRLPQDRIFPLPPHFPPPRFPA